MAKPCPNCDQPLREGAKFCTSCGYRLEKKPAPAPPPTPAPVPAKSTPKPQQARALQEQGQGAESEDVTCANCGKTNRQGVKFCRFCGSTLVETHVQTVGRRARIVTVGFLVLVLLMVCISIIGIGWGLGVDQLIFSTPTPTPEAVVFSLMLV